MISKKRNSNIEILRIVAMMMVLILHVDYNTLGEPTTAQANSYPIQTFAKVLFETISLISVNLFVLISGWFTIKSSLLSLSKFIFQCVFILSLMYLIGLFLGIAKLSVEGILECVFMSDNAWFVKSYIGLYILAPILNAYTEKVTRKSFLTTLIVFYSFQTLYGCVYYSAEYIIYGYSTFSFVGLYLLARYVRKYCDNLFKYGLLIWLSSLVIALLWTWIPIISGHLAFSYMAMHYSSPTTITGALGLLIWFASKRPRYNRIINWVAASCFAVYLCHICNAWTAELFMNTARDIYNDYSGIIEIGIISAFIITVFSVSIIVDQVRKLFWWIVSYMISKFHQAYCNK